MKCNGPQQSIALYSQMTQCIVVVIDVLLSNYVTVKRFSPLVCATDDYGSGARGKM